MSRSRYEPLVETDTDNHQPAVFQVEPPSPTVPEDTQRKSNSFDLVGFETPFASSSSTNPLSATNHSHSYFTPAAPLQPTSTDGVFSHMQALPNTSSSSSGASYGKHFEEFEPPSYNEIVDHPNEAIPTYMEATVVTQVSEDGDVLVEGLFFYLSPLKFGCFV
jgi:hypothetical protein